MVRGCQKKTIHIRDTGSKYYEEAYFILRPGVNEVRAGDKDMIREAVRIAEESMDAAPGRLKRKSGSRGIICFVFGLLTGALAVLVSFAAIL